MLSLALCGANAQTTGPERSAVVSGFQENTHARLLYNERTHRLEVRDPSGNLLEELNAGTAGRKVSVAGQEYLISFGKDERERPSVILRPGPMTQTPVSVEVFGQRAVVSPQASLFVALTQDRRVQAETSLGGKVYFPQDSDKENSR